MITHTSTQKRANNGFPNNKKHPSYWSNQCCSQILNYEHPYQPRKPGESKATFAPVLRRGVAEVRHALRCLQGQIFKQWGVPTGVAQGCRCEKLPSGQSVPQKQYGSMVLKTNPNSGGVFIAIYNTVSCNDWSVYLESSFPRFQE